MVRLNSGPSPRFCRLALVTVISLVFSALAGAQAPAPTGRIAGVVTDAKGTRVAGAQVTISAQAVQVSKTTTDDKGAYVAEGLASGSYSVVVEAKGFVTAQLTIDVKSNITSDGGVRLMVAGGAPASTDQHMVKDTLTAEQIESSFNNGRDFLALDQWEPVVQIQDGKNVDATKAGYLSLSLGSRSGRGTRISADGADITDEIVGTTTQNIPVSGIQSLSVEKSTLDLSTGPTSSGAVNVATKQGQNEIHGEAFGLFRDSTILTADLTRPFDSTTGAFLPTPYQRNQEGGQLGGPIIKDKAFFFFSGERAQQHLTAPVSVSSPFDQYSGTYAAPSEEDELQGRIDYSLRKTARLFGRFNYFKSSDVTAFFPSSFQLYSSTDHARNAVAGVDFNARNITHSIRFSYLNYQGRMLDATRGTSLPFASYPVSIDLGPFSVGANPMAPQVMVQSDQQIRYDGSKIMGSHLIRFGAGYNRIQAGGFATLLESGPQVLSITPGAISDPTAAPLSAAQVMVGNGQGYSTTQAALGYPAGGLGPDNRLDVYAGDTWKASPNLTISFGLRWERDTNLNDSDLPAIPELNSAFPSFGNAVRQPNANFAPQLGFAWDAKGDGKTLLRAGAGLYYENVPFKNLLPDRRLRQRTGSLLATPVACSFGTAMPVPTQTAGNITVDSVAGLDPITGRSYCADTVGQAAGALAAFQTTYQTDNPFSLTAANPNFVGALLASGLNIAGLLEPNYRTPRATQINAGFQHEIRRGLILSADYLHSVETRSLLGIDINHTGAERYFNPVSALEAVNLTVADCGAPSVGVAIGPSGCPGIHPATASTAAGAATVTDFAVRGMGGPADTGSSCYTAKDPSTGKSLGFQCAFGGINPNYGSMNVLEPIGRSVYQAGQVKLSQSSTNPYPRIEAVNVQIAYSWSRLKSPVAFQGNTPPLNPFTADDPELPLQAADNDNPLRYTGPSSFDRTNQISFTGTVDGAFGFRLAVAGHFFSPLSSPAIVGATGTAGQIFQTDFTGSGVGSQPLPGTSNGAFMRSLDVNGLSNAVSRYNASGGGALTPAGQALSTSGAFASNPATATADLQTIGAVAPTLNPPQSDQLVFPWLKVFDARLSWSRTFRGRFTVEPGVALFNAFNMGNFNLPPGAMSGWLNEGAGSINSVHTRIRPGETGPQFNTFRMGNGPGMFNQGTPRTVEWQLRFTF